MTPEFRYNETHDSEQEKRYERWLDRVRNCYGEDFAYGSAKESSASDLFLAGFNVLAATHKLEYEFGEAS